MKFGEILRNLINNKEITQKQLASDLNIAASTLGNYIQDSREPDFETLKRLADYFQVSIDYLLDYRSKKADSRMEDELLVVFRSLSQEQREMYLEQGKAIIKHNNKDKEKLSSSSQNKVG